MVDVALVDLHLPDGNETEVVRDLRATNPHGLTTAINPLMKAMANGPSITPGTAPRCAG